MLEKGVPLCWAPSGNTRVSGWEARAVGSTNINEQSSRSHLIVSLKAEIVTPGGDRLTSKINLVDLAGSERLRKSGKFGQFRIGSSWTGDLALSNKFLIDGYVVLWRVSACRCGRAAAEGGRRHQQVT